MLGVLVPACDSVRWRRRWDNHIALVRIARTAFVVEAFAYVFVALVPAALRIVRQISRSLSHICLLFCKQRTAAV
jgi:hypothetical protein